MTLDLDQLERVAREAIRMDLSHEAARQASLAFRRATGPATVLELIAEVRRLVDGWRVLNEENQRLVKAINEMPEWERAVKVACSEELAQLRAGLLEACDEWEEHAVQGGRGTRDELDRIDALRKLAKP